MPYVSLIVEALRARPVAVFWAATVLQALLWILVPSLFYASPPGDLPEVLAIGHEWQLGSWRGPPLAFWLAELAYNAAGGSVVGVYILAQICIVTTYWATFSLGRSIVGTQHAAMAVLLMGGIVAFSLPTPEFGSAVLAIPLTALALLHFWRALGEGRRDYWVALAFDLGLLLLTTYWGLLLVVAMHVFMLATRVGRSALLRIDPWAGAVVAVLVAFPHGVWLWQTGALRGLKLQTLLTPGLSGRLAFWPLLLFGVLTVHAGMLILVVLASAWRADRKLQAPEIERPVRSRLGSKYAWFFAVMPPLLGTLVASLLDTGGTARWAAPLVVMSGLAVVVAAGSRIVLHRQRMVGSVWFALVTLVPFLLVATILVGPWIGQFELSSDQPVSNIGRFFAETFRRRVDRPLEIVIGDMPATYLAALGAGNRLRVGSASNPGRTPWLNDKDVRAKGAIVVWPVVEATGQPPAAIRARFPEIVAEVPQTFERPLQGMLPTVRIGWGMIRPQAVSGAAGEARGVQ